MTVIVPTVLPYGEEFEECIDSVMQNHPAEIFVVTAGTENFKKALLINKQYPDIRVSRVEVPNKRVQICVALLKVRTLSFNDHTGE